MTVVCLLNSNKLEPVSAMAGHGMDRGGLKDSENASNSFFLKINWTVF